MKLRIPAVIAILALLEAGGFQEAGAQVGRPAFTPINSMVGRGGAVGAYYGIYRPQQQLMQLQSQINQANMNLNQLSASMQNMVNSSLPQTGRGATYNSLGHWYPSSRYGSTSGGMMGSRYGMVNTQSPLMMGGGMMGGGSPGMVGVVGGVGGGRR